MTKTDNMSALRAKSQPIQLGAAKRLTKASFVGTLSEGNGLRYDIG